MAMARASGTPMASSLKQNKFLTLKLCPGGVPRVFSCGWLPPPRGPPHISIPYLPCDLWGGHPRITPGIWGAILPQAKSKWGGKGILCFAWRGGPPCLDKTRGKVGYTYFGKFSFQKPFSFKLDGKSVPEALATTIRILLMFSIVLAHPWGAHGGTPRTVQECPSGRPDVLPEDPWALWAPRDT